MKLSYGLLAVIGLAEAGRKSGNREATTTSTTTTATTTSTASMATDTTPVVAAAGSFAESIEGNWNTSGNNVNVMLNAGDPITSATVVTTNNAGDLVLSVAQATIDETAGTITVDGNVGSIQPDGSVLFADGTSWAAGAATLTTTTTTTTTTSNNGVAPGATDAYGNPVDDGSSGGSTSAYSGGGDMGGDTGGDTTSAYGGGDSSGGDSSYNPSGSGYISGDPHVRVQTPGQKAVCYDIHGDALDYVSLIYDPNTELEVNGQLTLVKQNKSRLSAIGFKVSLNIFMKHLYSPLR